MVGLGPKEVMCTRFITETFSQFTPQFLQEKKVL